jgi:hypothetical protein
MKPRGAGFLCTQKEKKFKSLIDWLLVHLPQSRAPLHVVNIHRIRLMHLKRVLLHDHACVTCIHVNVKILNLEPWKRAWKRAAPVRP